jgi:hypothetical protein
MANKERKKGQADKKNVSTIYVFSQEFHGQVISPFRKLTEAVDRLLPKCHIT